MNFFAHLVVAAGESEGPAFLLGAMLPDLARMGGLGPYAACDEALARGIAMHHRTDAAFHGAPAFLELLAGAGAQLGRLGVRRGPGRAAAHVGLELLLDGVLAHDQARAALFRETLGERAARGGIGWRRPGDAEGFDALVRRLAAGPLPEAYRDPAAVAERLPRILARRPRLALGEREAVQVGAWVARARGPVAEAAPRLLDEVFAGLARAG